MNPGTNDWRRLAGFFMDDEHHYWWPPYPISPYFPNTLHNQHVGNPPLCKSSSWGKPKNFPYICMLVSTEFCNQCIFDVQVIYLTPGFQINKSMDFPVNTWFSSCRLWAHSSATTEAARNASAGHTHSVQEILRVTWRHWVSGRDASQPVSSIFSASAGGCWFVPNMFRACLAQDWRVLKHWKLESRIRFICFDLIQQNHILICFKHIFNWNIAKNAADHSILLLHVQWQSSLPNYWAPCCDRPALKTIWLPFSKQCGCQGFPASVSLLVLWLAIFRLANE